MAVVLKQKLLGSDIQPTRFSLADVQVEANEIIQQAHQQLDGARDQAESIIRRAETDAEQLALRAEQEGHRSGYEKGLAEGRQAGTQQALEQSRRDFVSQNKELRESLETLLNHVDRDRHALIGHAHQELLALAVAIAEKIVRTRIEVDPDAVVRNIQAAINLLTGSSAIKIKMHPTDLERLKLLDPAQAEKYFSLDQVVFVGDETVERGGCILGTAGGEIDTQISTQIDAVVRHFAGTMSERIRSWQAPQDDADPGSNNDEPRPERTFPNRSD